MLGIAESKCLHTVVSIITRCGSLVKGSCQYLFGAVVPIRAGLPHPLQTHIEPHSEQKVDKKLRLPGLEPGSNAWEASILTTVLKALHYYGHRIAIIQPTHQTSFKQGKNS